MMYSAKTCPVCDREFDEEGAMRAHLLVSHHKSDLADALFAAVDESESADRVVAE